MHRPISALRFVAALAVTLLIPISAHAQQAPGTPPPPPPPPPSGAPAANGEYTAPMSQQTQPSYVPQSVALSGPSQIKDWQAGDPVPAGYHEVTRVRKGLVIGGAVLFGSMYLISALVAAADADAHREVNSFGANSGSSDLGSLYIPAVGPFIALGSAGSDTGKLVLVIDGLAQSAGVAMLIYGITSPKSVLVRNDLGKIRVAPVQLGKGGYGMGLVGTF